jgi:hypothetical protein
MRLLRGIEEETAWGSDLDTHLYIGPGKGIGLAEELDLRLFLQAVDEVEGRRDRCTETGTRDRGEHRVRQGQPPTLGDRLVGCPPGRDLRGLGSVVTDYHAPEPRTCIHGLTIAGCSQRCKTLRSSRGGT